MIVPLIQGLKLTLKYFFSKKITLQYPEEKWDVAPRWRGRHVLTTHASGKIKCVACMLCATVCPANCISIEAAAEPDNRKYPEKYSIDLGRCIFCGFCVEVCPKEAIIMSTAYELSEYSREDLILDKQRLLQPPQERYVSQKKAG
jgi:NADH-quinone oxidoreductase chain I|uniref:NADH-quinone oxidoreductase subunit I n=1 Tax=Desulfomonile tiedjei TaxID=2358 RepID=A0A7C4AQ73_9BACT